MNFLATEYNPELGCYIKWLHGNPTQQIEKMYSMSAFHFFTAHTGYIKHTEYNKYSEYMLFSVSSIMNNTTDWYVRIYIDDSIITTLNKESPGWIQKINQLKQFPRVQIVAIKMPLYYLPASQSHQGLLAVLFRYLPLFDPNVGICLFRDLDNIWTEQHDYFTNKWLTEGTEEICMFLNKDYKRQQICELTYDDIILEDIYHTSVLSGIWNIRKPLMYVFPTSIWYKMFAYIESYTDFVNDDKYIGYKYHKVRFTYGFDELAISRIMLPIFINMGLKIYAIPIKIYDIPYISNLFDDPALVKFLKSVTAAENIPILKNLVLNNYWHMSSTNAGLPQYILCIITNIYFKLITRKSLFYKNELFLNTLQTRVYPTPLLMGLGLFTFKNYNRYSWYPNAQNILGGTGVVGKFISTNQRILIQEFTNDSDLSNNGDGIDIPPNPYGI